MVGFIVSMAVSVCIRLGVMVWQHFKSRDV